MMSSENTQATLASVLGEIVGLLRQSPLHRGLTIADLDWLVLPPIALRQFFLFRDGAKTIGLALWANCSPDVAVKLENDPLTPDNRLQPQDWSSGSELWLVDLIAPFATETNHQREVMVADLIAGPLKGRDLNLLRYDPVAGDRKRMTLGPNALDQIRAALRAAQSPAVQGQ